LCPRRFGILLLLTLRKRGAFPLHKLGFQAQENWIVVWYWKVEIHIYLYPDVWRSAEGTYGCYIISINFPLPYVFRHYTIKVCKSCGNSLKSETNVIRCST
jgi:hypothetical protein